MDAIERCMRKIKQRESTHKNKKMHIERVIRHEVERSFGKRYLPQKAVKA